MQPVVGAIADRSTSHYGRRRPFMVGGSIVTCLCLILLGWTKEIVSIFLTPTTPFGKNVVIVSAVFSIYALDFAINAVQACCRSIIVDVLPTESQQMGSAWATRMGASGSVVGFLIGTLPLVDILPAWLGGDTQFKKMCLVAILSLCFAVGLTCWAVKERVLIRRADADNQSGIDVLKTLWNRMFNLPDRIQLICWCQFWGWIGWFPFFFYSSTWVGETYYRYEHPEEDSNSHDALGKIGRLGSVSLVLFSFITFVSSVLLPYVVRKPDETDGWSPGATSTGGRKGGPGRFTPRPPPSLGKGIQKVLMKVYEAPKPDLVQIWGLSNLCFAFIMVWAPFVRSLRFATTLVALCGLPSAVSSWAPFAEMGIEINKLAHGGSRGMKGAGAGAAALRRGPYVAVQGSLDEEDDIELLATSTTGMRRRSSGASGVLRPQSFSEDDAGSGELAGVYLGVLNVYTTLPQFVGTFISWVVFSLFEPGKTEAGDASGGADGADGGKHVDHKQYLNLKGVNSIAVCLFIGAVCAVVAAGTTRKLAKMS